MKYTPDALQIPCITKIIQAVRNGRSSVCVVPTGGGKSVIAALAISELRDEKILFLAHRIELVNQFSAHLKNCNIKHGILTADTNDSGYHNNPVVVCSIDTLHARIKSGRIIPERFVVFGDEFHHAIAKTHRHVYESYKSAGSVIIGLTATPERLDGRGLFPLVEHIIMGPSPMDLIRSKRLVAAKIYSTDFPDLSKVTVSQGDFSRSESFELIQNTPITGRAIDHYINHAPGTKAIVFCINIKHAELVTAQFREHGINAVSVHSRSDNRDYIINCFRNGDIQVLITVDLISEGFDLPECETAILLRPTMSLTLFLQQCGRVLRAAHGKRWAIIIDAVGSVYRHGVPWQERSWSIFGRKARETQSGSYNIQVARCSKCFGCYDSKREACPFCGAGKQHKQRVIKTVDGTLRLMYDAEIEAMEAEAAKLEEQRLSEIARKATVKLTVKSARTKADLERIAKENGYKPGWVYYWCRLKRIAI